MDREIDDELYTFMMQYSLKNSALDFDAFRGSNQYKAMVARYGFNDVELRILRMEQKHQSAASAGV